MEVGDIQMNKKMMKKTALGLVFALGFCAGVIVIRLALLTVGVMW